MSKEFKPLVTKLASAGSGKTFALTTRYISLLFNEAKPNEILAITFTKKAAKEIKARIVSFLNDLVTKSGKYEEIKKDLNDNGISDEIIEKNAARIYEVFTSSKSNIGTIDSFLNAVLKKFCWYAGVSVNYQITTNENNDEFLEFFYRELNDEDVKNLAYICKSLELKKENILDLLKQFYLDRENINSEFINYYKNLDSSILQNRLYDIEKNILNLLQEFNKVLQTSNANSVAKNAIKDSSVKEFLNSSLKWLIEGEGYRYFKTPFAENAILKEKFNEIAPILKENCKTYFELKEQIIFSLLANLLEDYNRAKNKFFKSNNELSFNSVQLKNYELIVKNDYMNNTGIDNAFLHFRLDSNILHILIDEFQDTNISQYKIFLPLIDEIKSGIGQNPKERSLFFVGDKKQGIYGFRGGDSRVFDNVLVLSNMYKDSLDVNYRSNEVIVNFVNDLFRDEFSDYKDQKTSTNNLNKGIVKIKVIDDNSNIRSINEDKERYINNLQYSVLDFIKEILDSGIKESDVAILCYKNSDIELLSSFLQSNGIKVAPETKQHITQKQSVLIIISLLNIIKLLKENIESNISINERYIEFFTYQLRILLDRDLDSNDMELLNKLTKNDNISNIIYLLIKHFNIADKSALMFLETSINFASLNELLDSIDNIDLSSPKDELEGVKIITIHSSKGLEYPYVILCEPFSKDASDTNKVLIDENNKKLFYKFDNRGEFSDEYNNIIKENKNKEEQEELNVFYVACTRASKGLFIATNKYEKAKFAKLVNKIDDLNLNKTYIESDDLNLYKAMIYTKGSIESNNENKMALNQKEPKILKQIKTNLNQAKQTESNIKFNLDHINFGKATHLGLEYAIGFNINDNLKDLIRFNTSINQESSKKIIEIIKNLKTNENFNELIKNKKLLSEFSFSGENGIKRIDLIACNENEITIFDYKTGKKSNEHKEQILGYIDDLKNTIKKDFKYEGYVIYLSKNIEIDKVV